MRGTQAPGARHQRCGVRAAQPQYAGTTHLGVELDHAIGAGLEPFASGDQVSADPVTTAVWTGQTGDSLVTGHLGGSTIAVDLGAALVDLAARQGHVIALTDGAAPELLRLDATTGAILDRQPYVGALDRESMLLGDNGQSLVLTGRGHAQFYRVRTDAQMGL